MCHVAGTGLVSHTNHYCGQGSVSSGYDFGKDAINCWVTAAKIEGRPIPEAMRYDSEQY